MQGSIFAALFIVATISQQVRGFSIKFIGLISFVYQVLGDELVLPENATFRSRSLPLRPMSNYQLANYLKSPKYKKGLDFKPTGTIPQAGKK
jgi:hypothetical protein